MNQNDPLQKTKEDYAHIIERIQSEQSNVGIDAPYTHAVIIEYLKNIDERLVNIEKTLNMRNE